MAATGKRGAGAPARDPSHPRLGAAPPCGAHRGGGGREHSPSPALGGTAGDEDGGSASAPRRRLGPPHALRAAARPAARSSAAAAAASPPWRGEAAEGATGRAAVMAAAARGPSWLARARLCQRRTRRSLAPDPALAVRRFFIGGSETGADWPIPKGRLRPARAPPLRASERSLASSCRALSLGSRSRPLLRRRGGLSAPHRRSDVGEAGARGY